MTAIALDRTISRGRRAAREDARLVAARERLQNCRSVLGSLQASEREAVLSYDGPEIAGSMKSKRRRR
jgi:hypothetical protein